MLYDPNGTAFSEETPNGDAWVTGATLVISYPAAAAPSQASGASPERAVRRLKVERDPPTCVSLALPARIVARFPTPADVVLESCALEDCSITWFVGTPPRKEEGKEEGKGGEEPRWTLST